jgi:hypothetical protein
MERKRNGKVTKRRTSEAETPLGVSDAQTTVSPQPDQSGAHTRSLPTPDEIRQLAYAKWEAAGKPPGDGSDFWLQAETELLDRNVISGAPVRTRRRYAVASSGGIPPDAVGDSRPKPS